MRKLRGESWDSRLEGLSPSSQAYWALSRTFRSDTVATMPPLTKPDNTIAADDTEKAECLADSLEAQCSPSTLPCDPDHLTEVDSEVTEWASMPPTGEPVRPTDVEEVKSILKDLNPKKAPGPDKIPNKVLKSLPIHFVSLLVMIFNALLAGCSFPTEWKEAIVIGIRKPKKPANLPSSYRPISLISSLGKIYERIVLSRLKEIVEAKQLFINEQFGFRSHHSSIHQVHRLTEHIAKYNVRRSIRSDTAAIFLDIAKAFDKVWHNGLLFKLRRMALPDSLVHIIREYLSNRTFRYRLEGTLSSPRPVRAGVPQGSTLSPLLYALYTSDIPRTDKVELAMYADDTALYTTDRSAWILAERLQRAADALGDWFSKWRFEVNPEKSVAVLFPRKRYETVSTIYLQGKPIPWESKVKYLGVVLDSKLSFRPHITYVRNKATYVMNRLYPLICKRSKMSLRNKLTLYKTCIRPVMTYACVVFSHTKIDLLQRVQNKFLRMASGCPWYVSNVDPP